MRVLLFIFTSLSLCAHGSERPVYWQYPGPFGQRLEDAFSSVKTPREQRQLISEADRRSHLKKNVRLPKVSGCLEDRGTCRSEVIALLDELALDGRVIATAKRTDLGYEITLRFESQQYEKARPFTAEAATLEQAAREVLDALHGRGTLSLNVTPDSALFFLNDVPYGQGSGDHLVTSGDHTLRVEAPGYKSESMPLKIKTGQRVRVNVSLAQAGSRLSLKTNPPNASVYLNGERWNDYGSLRTVDSGEHLLRVELKGHNTFSQKLNLKPNTVSELELSLVPSDPPWRRAIKTHLPETKAMPAFFRLHYDQLSVRDRRFELGTNLGELERMGDPLGGQNIGFALSLRKGNWLLDALRVKYTTASGNAASRMENFGDVQVTDLSRLTIAPAWVGLQRDIWRVVPYAMTGVLINSETVNGKTGASRFTGEHIEIKLGAELGLRYVFSQSLFAGIHYGVEGMPGYGNNHMIGLHIGYAFELPSFVEAMLK